MKLSQKNAHSKLGPIYKIATYNTLIAEENIRMHKHVEKILHMAALEEGEVELRLDLHEIIRNAVGAAKMQVAARGGSIVTRLDATHSMIIGDGVHIENVIRNLLDNAEKYSPESPYITVSTGNTNRHVVVRISDRGIGMTKEHATRAFEKYYLVPTWQRPRLERLWDRTELREAGGGRGWWYGLTAERIRSGNNG